MQIKSTSKIQLEIMFTVTEQEARALEALSGYSHNEFIKHFYETLGEHYMKPHEKGLRSFLETVSRQLPSHLRRVDEARNLFEKDET